jgi:hypothetical protein
LFNRLGRYPDRQPADGNPIGPDLVFEDARARVWRIVPEPGEEAPWHTHEPDYTSVSVEGDVIERLNADGTVEHIAVRPGAFTRWRQGAPPGAAQRRRRPLRQRDRGAGGRAGQLPITSETSSDCGE